MGTEKTILAIDPGSSKCGFAVVTRKADGKLSLDWRRVVPVEDLEKTLLEAREQYAVQLIVVGDGTRSRPIVERVRTSVPSMAVLIVDEKDTSIEARARYWEHHKRRGWRKLLPSTMQTPPEPVDDFVALILAERVLGSP